jgi:hypothetical protein
MAPFKSLAAPQTAQIDLLFTGDKLWAIARNCYDCKLHYLQLKHQKRKGRGDPMQLITAMLNNLNGTQSYDCKQRQIFIRT